MRRRRHKCKFARFYVHTCTFLLCVRAYVHGSLPKILWWFVTLLWFQVLIFIKMWSSIAEIFAKLSDAFFLASTVDQQILDLTKFGYRILGKKIMNRLLTSFGSKMINYMSKIIYVLKNFWVQTKAGSSQSNLKLK